MSCNVAFIGLGVMGYPMAGYISKDGHNVTVFNRTKTKAEKWIKEYKGKMAETPAEAAKDADWFLLVGSIPRGIVFNGKKIEERADLLQINGGIFVGQGQAIGRFGKSDAKILVVGNPANTNALIGRHAASNDSQLWMAMTMLDSSRARSVLSKKLHIGISDISKMIIWGNHSPTMYPDFENIVANGSPGKDLIDDMDWVNNKFLPVVQQRGKAVIDSRGASSATSAAKAALDTVVACENPSASGDVLVQR